MLIGFFTVVLVVMTYKIVATSLQSSLFYLMANWQKPGVNPYPWFNAILWDFYANFLIVAFWVWYKESQKITAIFWIICLALLGSPATALYIIIKLLKLNKDEGLKELICKKG